MNILTRYLNHKHLYQTIAIILVILVSAFVSQVQAEEADGARLVRQHRCYPCHDMTTETLLGPPYKAIALRHAEHKDIMVNVLAEKIIRGGGSNRGVVPMVPSEHVSREEARVIAKWILNLGQDTK